MTVRPILTFPNNLLRKRAIPVKNIDDEVKGLINDMRNTLLEASGIGLAANQIGVLKRIVVLNIPDQVEMSVFINPEVLHRSGRREISEGCLSFPGYSGIVNRSVSVTVRYIDEAGGKIKITAEQLLSQALEHEIDHLNGILFIDHLKEHEMLSLSVPDYGLHSHDLNVSVDVTEEGKGSEFNEKLYTKIKVEDLKEALSRAHILKEVE